MSLTQTGTAVSGTIEVSGRADVSGPLAGTVSGDTVRLKLSSGSGSTGELNVSGNTITGVVGGNSVRCSVCPEEASQIPPSARAHTRAAGPSRRRPCHARTS
jgi:hypothetical protein